LFFDVFNLRAGEEWCEEWCEECLGSYYYYYYFLRTIFSFALMQKKQKIKPENTKLKNYLKVPFRSTSRSPFRLNSRTAASLLFRCFLCFLFKGVGRVLSRVFREFLLLLLLLLLFPNNDFTFLLDKKSNKKITA
jgi:hypothetical protein